MLKLNFLNFFRDGSMNFAHSLWGMKHSKCRVILRNFCYIIIVHKSIFVGDEQLPSISWNVTLGSKLSFFYPCKKNGRGLYLSITKIPYYTPVI